MIFRHKERCVAKRMALLHLKLKPELCTLLFWLFNGLLTRIKNRISSNSGCAFRLIFCYFLVESSSPGPDLWAYIWRLRKYNCTPSISQAVNSVECVFSCCTILHVGHGWEMTHTPTSRDKSAESRSLELCSSTWWNGKWPGGRAAAMKAAASCALYKSKCSHKNSGN